MSTCSGLNLVQSIFAVCTDNPDVGLSCAKFSSSLVDIKLCHKPVKACFSTSEEVSLGDMGGWLGWSMPLFFACNNNRFNKT